MHYKQTLNYWDINICVSVFDIHEYMLHIVEHLYVKIRVIPTGIYGSNQRHQSAGLSYIIFFYVLVFTLSRN